MVKSFVVEEKALTMPKSLNLATFLSSRRMLSLQAGREEEEEVSCDGRGPGAYN